jgi:3-deoxy-manno-octulosonate cytidylyltransferase (CMP-KDO synthetase)
MEQSTGAIAIIPARYGSSRFPGKPLAQAGGKPLIQHVVETAQQARTIERVLVATDDHRIADAVTAFGGEAMLTGEHPNGTARLAEVAQRLDLAPDQIIVNLQGDEPELPPSTIDQLVATIERDTAAPMATLASPFAANEDPADPNIVKLVTSQHGRALYFSRSLIPCDRDAEMHHSPLKHPGMYAYRRWFLLRYVQLEPTPLEQAEKLEQLRALEHGYPIAVACVTINHHGIDTPEQHEAFAQRLADQPQP